MRPLLPAAALALLAACAPPPEPPTPAPAPVEVTTASSEAYEKYTEARRLVMEDGDRRGSIARVREALALDPEFAMAWRLLAVNFNAQGRVGESRHALQKALEYSSHVSATEQLHIAAVDAQYSDYNLQESIRLYGELLMQSPNDRLAHYNRALALRRLGAYDDALIHLDRFRELSPQGVSRPAARVRFRTLVSLGRIEEAETFLPNLRDVDRRVGAMMLAMARRDWAIAESLGVATGREHSSTPWWLVVVASARAARGAVRAADSTLHISTTGGWQQHRLILALATECVNAVGRIMPIRAALPDTTYAILVRQAMWAATVADTARARHLQESASHRPNHEILPLQTWNTLVDALSSRAAQDWPAVVEVAARAAGRGEHSVVGTLALRWLVGEAYERMGQLDSAIAYFRLIVHDAPQPRAAIMDRGFAYPFAQRRLASLYARLGQFVAAEAHWEAFRSAFTTPDPQLQWLVEISPLELAKTAVDVAVAEAERWRETCTAYHAERIEEMQSALWLLREAQDSFHTEHRRYAPEHHHIQEHMRRVAALRQTQPISRWSVRRWMAHVDVRDASPLGVSIWITHGDSTSWSAEVIHHRSYAVCRVTVNGPPGQSRWSPVCEERDPANVHREETAYMAMQKSLLALAAAKEADFRDNGTLTRDTALPWSHDGDTGSSWRPFGGSRVDIRQADGRRFLALATHPDTEITCALKLDDQAFRVQSDYFRDLSGVACTRGPSSDGLQFRRPPLQFRRPPLQTNVAEPVARRIYLKLPLQHVRFHWRFMSREDLLSGKLVLRIRRGDLTNEIVIFENGAFAPDWEAMSAGPGPGEIYFGFRSTTTFLTAPDDELEVELLVLKDLAGIGVLQTGILTAGTYRAKGTYFGLQDDFDSSQPMSAAQMIDSLTEQGVTRDEAEMMAQTVQRVYLAMRINAEAFSFIAYTGCWENLSPLKITSNEGWASPEQIAFQERNLEIERAAIERAGGPNCSGPA